MNDTASSASGASLLPDSTDLITNMHLGILVILAVLAVAVIVWGARLKGKRKAAEAELREHNEEVAAPAADVARSDDGTARAAERSFAAPTPTPAPVPVAPAPPPIADAPVLGTPPVETPAPEPRNDEPIAATAPQTDNPATIAAPAAAPQAPAASANPADGPVTQLKGLGPKVASRLAELGVTTVSQLAALDDDDAARLDADLAPFSGRMSRDRWIEQARLLAAGDKAGFEATFGRL